MSLFKSFLKWKGYPLTKAEKSLLEFYSLSLPEKNQWIESKKRLIVAHHIQNNPMYKKHIGKIDPKWEELPILTKNDLQLPIDQMLSEGYDHSEVYVSNTSGSSGHPFFFAKDKFSHALTWAFIFNRYESLGIRTTDLQARFYGIPLDNWSYIKEKAKDFIMNRVRFSVFDLGDEMLESYLNRFKRSRFNYIYGYTNSILLLVNFLKQKGIILKELCSTLKICIVTSEVCTEEDKRSIEQVLGIPVIREYGASELDIIGIEDTSGHWEINEASLYVEVLSEKNEVLPIGTEGRLIITSLHNKAMPFIRYDIGDVGMLDQDESGIFLRKLSGRVNDTIILPSGKKSPGLTFYYVSRSILESSGVLKEFIVRQTKLNSFEFDIVSDRSLTNQELQEIQKKMDEYLEPGLKLKVNKVDKIQRPASGKTKHFYSELTG